MVSFFWGAGGGIAAFEGTNTATISVELICRCCILQLQTGKMAYIISEVTPQPCKHPMLALFTHSFVDTGLTALLFRV